MKKRLELHSDKAHKFWEITLEDQHLIITSGKVGTEGKTSTKDCKSIAKASLEYKKAIYKKMTDGYMDIDQPLVKLSPIKSQFNDSTFLHNQQVRALDFNPILKYIVSTDRYFIYLWDTNGQLLDKIQTQLSASFYGEFQIEHHENYFYFIMRDEEYFEVRQLAIEDQKIKQTKVYQKTVEYADYYFSYKTELGIVYLSGVVYIQLDWDLNCIHTNKLTLGESCSFITINRKGTMIAFNLTDENSNKTQTQVIKTDGSKLHAFETPRLDYILFNESEDHLITVYTQTYGTYVQEWDIRTGKELKKIDNYAARGFVSHALLSPQDQLLWVRKGVSTFICFDLVNDRQHWLNSDFYGEANSCFYDKNTLLLSQGKRLQFSNISDGTFQLSFKGLNHNCTTLIFEEDQQTTWIGTSDQLTIFDSNGKKLHQETRSKIHQSAASNRFLLQKDLNGQLQDYFWFDPIQFEKTPIFSGDHNSIAFSKKYIATSEGYFSKQKKCIRIWTPQGKLVKALKMKEMDSLSFYQENFVIGGKGTSLFIWDIEKDEAIFTGKKCTTKGIQSIHVHPSAPVFLSQGDKEIILWDFENQSIILQEQLLNHNVAILAKPHLSAFLLVDFNGYIYSICTKKKTFQLLSKLPKQISKATLTDAGQLIYSSTDMEISSVDLSGVLDFSKVNTKTTSSIKSRLDLTVLASITDGSSLLDFLKDNQWEKAHNAEELEALRSKLISIENQEGVGPVHHHFSSILLSAGARLKHSFGHEENWINFALSPDGKYFTASTWVGEDYENDGTFQIWEVETGRTIQHLKAHYGGVGWPDYYHQVQWSPAHNYIGAGMNTNSVNKLLPFSGTPMPVHTNYVTDGGNRPPAWCWAADSKSFFVSAWSNDEIPLCQCDTKENYVNVSSAKWMSGKIDPKIKSVLGTDDFYSFKWMRASQDGNVVYGHTGNRYAVAIDLKKEDVLYINKINYSIAWSPTDDFYVLFSGTSLAYYDTKKGNLMQEVEFSNSGKFIHFAPNQNRFAIVEINQIHIFDETSRLGSFTLPNDIGGSNNYSSELRPVTFSPDGKYIAALLEKPEIVILEIGEDIKEIKRFKTNNLVQGIFWGKQLILAGPQYVGFNQMDGRLLHATDKAQQVASFTELYPEIESPLQLKNHDLNERFDLPPHYPFKYKNEAHWLLALETGLVISPSPHVPILDKHLSYVWNHRMAWPYRWAKASIFDHMANAKGHPRSPFNKTEQALFKLPTGLKKKASLAFNVGGSPLDLVSLYKESIKELSGNWGYHVSKQIGYIAHVLVKHNKFEQAFQMVSNSTEFYVRVANLGFLAIELQQAGANDWAKKALDQAKEELEVKNPEGLATFANAPVAAACHHLGDKEGASKYFEQALVHIHKESNSFEKYRRLAYAYSLTGNHEKGFEIISSGPWDNFYSMNRYVGKYLVYLLNNHQIEWMEKLYKKCVDALGKPLEEFDLLEAGVNYYLSKKAYAQVEEWMQRFPRLSTKSYQAKMLQTMKQNGDTAQAEKYILEKIESTKEYLPTQLRYFAHLSNFNPSKALELLVPILEKEKIKASETGIADIGKILSHAEDPSLLDSYFNTLSKPRYQFQLLCHSISKKGNWQDGMLEKATLIYDEMNISERQQIQDGLMLIQAAEMLDKKEVAKSYMEKILFIASNSQDKEDAYSTIQTYFEKKEDYEMAYQMLKKQKPAQRKYMIPPFVNILVQKGYWKTSGDLLSTLSAKDLNDRLSGILTALKYG